jgi:hypothetical protein
MRNKEKTRIPKTAKIAASAYGAYRLAKYLTGKTGKKRAWRDKVGRGHEAA